MNEDKANLTLRGDVWYFNKIYRGTRVVQSTGEESLVEARKFRDRALAALKAGRMDDLSGVKLRSTVPTLGRVIATYQDECSLRGEPRPATVTANVAAFKRVVRMGRGMEPLSQVDRLPSTVLTADLAREYGRAMLKGSAAEEETCRRSICSNLRQARSVLKPDLTRSAAFKAIALPDVSGFLTEYVSKDPVVEREKYSAEEEALLRSGAELKAEQPELYAVWFLGFHLALRASEMVAARLDWIEGDELVIKKRPAQGFDPKRYSGWVPLSESVMAELREMAGEDGHLLPGTTRTGRRNLVARTFATWMRKAGWDREHCAHELRAFRGQLWRDAYGLEVARDWMRHASDATTRRSYTVNHNRSQKPMEMEVVADPAPLKG